MKRLIPLFALALTFALSSLAFAKGDRHRHHGPEVFNFAFASSKGRLGVQVNSMTEELRQFFGAPKDAGLLVARVVDDSPAKKAGIKVGDVIIEVDGERVEDVGDVMSVLRGRDDDSKVPVVLVRRKKKITKKLEIESGRSFTVPGRSNRSLAKDLERTQRKLEEIEERLRAIEGKKKKKAKLPKKAKPPKKKQKTKKKAKESDAFK